MESNELVIPTKKYVRIEAAMLKKLGTSIC